MNKTNQETDTRRQKAAEAANAYEAAIIAQARKARHIAPEWIERQRYEATVAKLREAANMVKALREAGKNKLTLTECADLLLFVLTAEMFHPHRTSGERLLEGEEARARLAEIAGHQPTEADLDNAPPDLLDAIERAGLERLIMDKEIKLIATLKARGRSKTTPLATAIAVAKLAQLTPYMTAEDRAEFATDADEEKDALECTGGRARAYLKPRDADALAPILEGENPGADIRRLTRNSQRRERYRKRGV